MTERYTFAAELFALAPPKAEGASTGYDGPAADDRFSDDIFALPSGRTFYANQGIIGIDPGGSISQGYDGGLEPSGEGDFTPDERRQLAEMMIERWRKFGGL